MGHTNNEGQPPGLPLPLQKSIEKLEELYPQLKVSYRTQMGHPIATWRGWIQPIKSRENLEELLDDLYHDRQVWVAGDTVRHWGGCEEEHRHHDWMGRVSDPFIKFDMEVRHDGSRLQPKCWIHNLNITDYKRKHLNHDLSICPFLISEDVWVWDRDTVAEIVPHYLIWLVKWLVFDQTSEWIGSEHNGAPSSHLSLIGRNRQCWCGSGKKYKKCHLQHDQILAQRKALGLRSLP